MIYLQWFTFRSERHAEAAKVCNATIHNKDEARWICENVAEANPRWRYLLDTFRVNAMTWHTSAD